MMTKSDYLMVNILSNAQNLPCVGRRTSSNEVLALNS